MLQTLWRLLQVDLSRIFEETSQVSACAKHHRFRRKANPANPVKTSRLKLGGSGTSDTTVRRLPTRTKPVGLPHVGHPGTGSLEVYASIVRDPSGLRFAAENETAPTQLL